MRLVIIVNDVAGHGKAKKLCEKLVQSLTIPHIVERTKYAGHAVEIAAKYGEDGQSTLLLAIGGDGTIHEVIKGSFQFEQLVVGVMNGGSGNDFGRAYPVFSKPEDVERFVHSNRFVFQDLGMISNGEKRDVFMNNCGFGIDAVVTTQVNISTAKKYFNKVSLGKLAYVWILFRELIRFKKFDLEVIVQGEKHTYSDCYFVVASNQPFFGGGMKISPLSKMEDGLLELTIVNNLAKWRLLLVFGTVFFGKHTKLKAVKQFQASQFEVTINAEVVGHADGEFIGKSLRNEVIQYGVKQNGWRLATNKLD